MNPLIKGGTSVRKVLLCTVIFLLLATTAFAAPAEPFTDLPRSHWAYEAAALLAQQGIIDGYPDKTFQGDKTMTRYEMAQIVAKAMANEAKANIAQRALIDKMASEFALDMNKIKTRLAKVEEKQDKVKISGELTEQYKVKSDPTRENAGYGQEKFRLNIVGKVDDNSTVTIRIADPAPSQTMFKRSTHNKFGEWGTYGRLFDRLYGTTKFGAFTVSVGRQGFFTDPDDLILDSDFFNMDGATVGIALDKNFDLSFQRGRLARDLDTTGSNATWAFNGNTKADMANIDVQSIALTARLDKLKATASFVQFDRALKKNPNKTLMGYTIGNVEYKFDDQYLLGFTGGSNGEALTKGGFRSVKFIYGVEKPKRAGQQNFTVTYAKFDRYSLYYAFSSLDCPDEGSTNDPFTDLDLAWKLALSPNLSLKLEWGKIRDLDAPAQNYNFWKASTGWKF